MGRERRQGFRWLNSIQSSACAAVRADDRAAAHHKADYQSAASAEPDIEHRVSQRQQHCRYNYDGFDLKFGRAAKH